MWIYFLARFPPQNNEYMDNETRVWACWNNLRVFTPYLCILPRAFPASFLIPSFVGGKALSFPCSMSELMISLQS